MYVNHTDSSRQNRMNLTVSSCNGTNISIYLECLGFFVKGRTRKFKLLHDAGRREIKMRSFLKWAGIVVIMLLAFPVLAQEVTEDIGPVKINWTSKEMVFTGDGAPDLNAPNAASARLGAERAAYADALRKALEALKGVKVSAGMTVGDKMSSVPSIKTEIQGYLRGFKAVDKRYFSDGGVQIDLKIPLDGVLMDTVFKDKMKKEPVKKEEKGKAKPKAKTDIATGLVIVAENMKVIPVLAPRITDEKGKDVYDVTMVTKAGLENGIVSYNSSTEKAMSDKKVADKPLVIKAKSSPNNVDLVVSDKDAAKIRELAENNPFLAEGRVIIVKNNVK